MCTLVYYITILRLLVNYILRLCLTGLLHFENVSSGLLHCNIMFIGLLHCNTVFFGFATLRYFDY